MPALPTPDDSKPSIDWDNEIVTELRSDGMYEEMVGMASGEFKSHIRDLRKMQKQAQSKWGSWPPWKVAHSIKGLCLSLSFTRLAHYAQSVEQLKDSIELDDLQQIITEMEVLFATALEEATKIKT
eukprot:CAMPEP_0118906870 /NCGR_PEP_ID=MMETSP1166-20130328/10572_1 /TAXON_ID=1104430 /ORGANISM="Chrysoreinhardia sp, Strain CCMP3193" /LENGTH=125 /DNA_ID=CAMNT_0006846227 /DNA_START=22 /DNA_END=399 /DNA_ORIENTATION=+